MREAYWVFSSRITLVRSISLWEMRNKGGGSPLTPNCLSPPPFPTESPPQSRYMHISHYLPGLPPTCYLWAPVQTNIHSHWNWLGEMIMLNPPVTVSSRTNSQICEPRSKVWFKGRARRRSAKLAHIDLMKNANLSGSWSRFPCSQFPTRQAVKSNSSTFPFHLPLLTYGICELYDQIKI